MPLWIPTLTMGQEQPKLAICDDDTDYISNSDFEGGKAGWTGGTWEEDKEGAPYGENVLKVSAETVQTTCDVGSELGARTFVVCLFAKSATPSATIYIGNEEITIAGLSASIYQERAVVHTFATYRATTSFDVQVKSLSTLHIDGVHCYEVDTYSASMPNPTYEELKHVRELRPESVSDFTVTNLSTGWRFYGFLKWVGLTLPEQTVAEAIPDAEIVVYWPHSDEEDCVSCRPSTSQAVLRYVFNSRLTTNAESILLEGLAMLFSESVATTGGS